MSRARNIKPGFFKNDVLADCCPLARLLFAGLWCEADREGRLDDRPKRIKVECLPYDECDVDALLNELAAHGFILRYTHEQQQYIQVLEFKKHQNPHCKEQASTIPAPCLHGASTEVAGLIPDSLNLIPDSSKKKKQRPAVKLPSVGLDSKQPELFAGVPAQIVADFKALRTKLRAPITQTAMAGIEREAAKAGVSVSDALRLCCERGWRGFKAEWVTEPARGSPSKPPIAQSFAGKHYEGTPDDQLPPSLRPDPPRPAP